MRGLCRASQVSVLPAEKITSGFIRFTKVARGPQGPQGLGLDRVTCNHEGISVIGSFIPSFTPSGPRPRLHASVCPPRPGPQVGRARLSLSPFWGSESGRVSPGYAPEAGGALPGTSHAVVSPAPAGTRVPWPVAPVHLKAGLPHPASPCIFLVRLLRRRRALWLHGAHPGHPPSCRLQP